MARRRLLRALAQGFSLALAVGVVLHLAHRGLHERHEIHPLLHWLRDSLLAAPLAVFALLWAIPIAAWIVPVRGTAAQRRVAWALAAASAYALGSIPGNSVHARLFGAHEEGGSFALHAAQDASTVLGPAVVVLLAFVAFWGVPGERGAPSGRALVLRLAPDSKRPLVAGALVAALLAPLGAPIPGIGPGTAAAESGVASCDEASADRSYDVRAITVDVPFNRWGDHNPNGQIYVLEQDENAVKNWFLPLAADPAADPAGNRRLRPRPLVLRANEGECVEVTFTNELNPTPGEGLAQNPRASIHVHGPSYDVQTSDGSRVGWNDDTTVAIGETINYFWRVPDKEGVYFFHDHGNQAGSEADGGSNAHGLYGALAVEPAGSIWLDPVSNQPLYTGTTQQSGELYVDAIIVPPAAQSAAHDGSIPDLHAPNTVAFRESIQISQDEIPGVNGQFPDLGVDIGIGFGFNFGVEQLLLRQLPVNRCPDCVGEETWLSSWPYGDPGLVKLASGTGPWYPAWHPLFPGNGGQQNPGNVVDPEDCGLEDNPVHLGNSCWTSNVTHAYQFDATKIRFLHAGVKETHVFHMHAHQWLADPFDVGNSGSTPGQPGGTPSNVNLRRPEATTVDSQTYGPGEGFTNDVLFGAGSKPGTIGDAIFHCHLYPHFAEGFWSLFRIHDVLEDGTGVTPDGIGVRRLFPLPDRANAGDVPLPPTDLNPGYPRAIPGEFGWRAPQPINGVSRNNGGDDVVGTVPREDLEPAARIVAGKQLDESLLQATQTISIGSTNEVQSVSNDATGGTFTLTFGGATTGPIGYDAAASAVEAALEALAAITDVAVTSPGSQSWEITFLDPGGQDVAPLSADDTALVGGTTSITTLADGGQGPSGTFALSFAGATTGAVDAATVDASAIESALEALTTVHGATVTGTGPFDVRLDLWTETPSLLLSADTSSLTGSLTITPSRDDLDDPQVADIAYRLARERHWSLQAYNPGYLPTTDPFSVAQPKPGAPYVDPCPAGVREVTYNVSVIQLDIVYNDNGWHDPQGRALVLDRDVDAVLSGAKAPEPLFFRANAGDCINFNLTNRLPNFLGNDDFLELIQTNMVGQHIHLVKFDVLGSDGASNGWNPQEAAFSQDQQDFNDGLFSDPPTTTCGADTFDADQSLVADGCRVPMPPTFSPTWSCPNIAGCPIGQTVHERWYADYELRTVFTHDHHFPAEDQNRGYFAALVVEPTGMDVRNPFNGQFLQPINSPANGTPCGASCEAFAVGVQRDIIGPGQKDDFREYGLALQDFTSLYRDCQPGGEECSTFIDGQEPLAPPDHPEQFPDDDPGIMGINYRNEPFLIRDTLNGKWVDPAYRFSSTVFGDPATPTLLAYAKDPIRVRLIQGAQEEQHVVQIHGMRWLDEPDDPGSPWVNSRALGISDAFNFEIPPMTCGASEDCRGDFLYSGTATDDIWLGVWGIIRVFGKGVPQLLPLPDNVPQAATGSVSLTVTGNPPPKANQPGNPCAAGATVRPYHVIAVDAEIQYNAQGDHDPYGLVYAVLEPGETPAQGAARVRGGNPEPMVLRAREHECLEVTLTNMVDPSGPFATQHGPLGAADADPPLVLEPASGTPAGLRVSLHANLLSYDVRGSDGATVGFNKDQTVAPGESILYRWWAENVTPGELGAINLLDYGDVRGHRHHGLFAGLIVEPIGATWHDPLTGEPITGGAQADIRVPSPAGEVNDFRELPVFFQDGLNLRDAAGAPLPDQLDHPLEPGAPPEHAELPDAEDRGEKAFNYRNAPFHHRLGQGPGEAHDDLDGQAVSDVWSSVVHGDPDTPIFRAYAGDPVKVRVLQGQDKPRQHAFQLNGHTWPRQPFDDPARTELIANSGGISVGRMLNLPIASAGGPDELIGDYKYNCAVSFHHQSGGLWGIMRVYDPPGAGFTGPDDLLPEDNPFTGGYHPLMPLEVVSVGVGVFDDTNTNGSWGPGESAIPGAEVTLYTTSDPPALVGTLVTGADGKAYHTVPAGAYDAVVTVPPDWGATTSEKQRIEANIQANSPYAAFGLVQLGDITVDLFHDVANLGTRDAGEEPLAGWTVNLKRSTSTWTGTTGADGSVLFDGLRPGTYTVEPVVPPGWYRTYAPPLQVDLPENGSLSIAAGYTLEAGMAIQAFNDSDRDGEKDPGESWLRGWRVTAEGGEPGSQTLLSNLTDSSGTAEFKGVAAGRYKVDEALQKDWSFVSASARTTKGSTTSTTPGFSCPTLPCETELVEQTTQVVTLANHNPNVWVVAEPFNDPNNNGTKDGSERKLVGWQVELRQTHAGGVALPSPVPKGTMLTGNGGTATFYVDPGALGEARFEVVFTPPAPPAGEPQTWTPTPATGSTPVGGATRTVSVLPGETALAQKGFIQRGKLVVDVFHDHDRNGNWDQEYAQPENPLANRTVRLYDRRGKTLIAEKVTTTDGLVSFPVSAGTEYVVEVVAPNGWSPTTPLSSNGRPTTITKILTNADPVMSTSAEFGQYSDHDVTPPPDPQASPPPGLYQSTQNVTLSSEAGATIKYTLDGSAPGATKGTVYSTPIFAGEGTTTIKAVAIDQAGNISDVVTFVYVVDLGGGTEEHTGSPTSWSLEKGAVVSGGPSQFVASDDQRLVASSVRRGKGQAVIGSGSATSPAEQVNVTAIELTYEGHSSPQGAGVKVLLWNFQTASWTQVLSRAEAASDVSGTVGVAGDPKRFVSATREIRVRVEATADPSFELRTDVLSLTVTYTS